MFGHQALRLLREGWKGPRELAEEIYAILSSDDMPLEHNGPIILNGGGDDPPLQLRGFSDGDVVMRIKRGDEEYDLRFEEGDLIFPGFADEGRPGEPPPQPPKSPEGIEVFMGEILDGEGDTYSVQLDGGGKPVLVKQLQIADGEKIPAGTKTPVFNNKEGLYFMQVPVWMDG